MLKLKLTSLPVVTKNTLQGNQVYIYKGGAHYTLVEGYPKTLKEELGIEGRVDAAFVCPNENIVHVIQGELTENPPNLIRYRAALFTNISSNRTKVN